MEEMNNTFKTGSTHPPKSHQGLIAVLLVMVILLGGIATLLGVMNIRLFRMLEKQETGNIPFSQETVPAIAQSVWKETGNQGFSCKEIDDVYRSYQQWPQGLYIAEVTPGSPAEKADLQIGDILTKVNNIPVNSEKALAQLLKEYTPGDCLTLTVHRDGQERNLRLTIS